MLLTTNHVRRIGNEISSQLSTPFLGEAIIIVMKRLGSTSTKLEFIHKMKGSVSGDSLECVGNSLTALRLKSHPNCYYWP